MDETREITPERIALRAHDITVCLEGASVPEFDLLALLGMAVRLALHLRGVQAISYDLTRLTAVLADRLSASPIPKEHAYQMGAEKKLVDRVLTIGVTGSFIIDHRSQGRSVIVSPTYFPESTDAYANLVAGEGAGRVKKVLDLLKSNQGWPLQLLEGNRELAGVTLDDQDLQVIKALAGEGFVPPPAIQTGHAGTTHF